MNLWVYASFSGIWDMRRMQARHEGAWECKGNSGRDVLSKGHGGRGNVPAPRRGGGGHIGCFLNPSAGRGEADGEPFRAESRRYREGGGRVGEISKKRQIGERTEYFTEAGEGGDL